MRAKVAVEAMHHPGLHGREVPASGLLRDTHSTARGSQQHCHVLPKLLSDCTVYFDKLYSSVT